jgi:hypothetical protein
VIAHVESEAGHPLSEVDASVGDTEAPFSDVWVNWNPNSRCLITSSSITVS